MRKISSCDAEIQLALDMFHVCIPLWFIIIDIFLLPSAVLCFNSHPQANPGVWKKSTYWKWGSPCCISFLVGQVRRCSVHSPCCIRFRLSFYQLFFSYSIVFPGIITAALAPCSSQFLHVFNRRNITWSHILSVNTNPFLSDKLIWPFLPSATYTQYPHLVCQCVLLSNFIHSRVVITTIFNSGYRINSLWICASILLGIQWTMGNAHLSRWWQSQSLSSLGVLLVSFWIAMRTSLRLPLETEGTGYGNESR